MSYAQYTSCVKPGSYIDLSFNAIGIRNILIMLSTGAVMVWVVAVILGGPVAITAAIVLMTAVVTYLYWWLHGRLICLNPGTGDGCLNTGPGDVCLIGVVASLGPSNPVDKAGDNDFTMDLLLAPGPTNYVHPISDYTSQTQGCLINENAQITAIGRGYVQDQAHIAYRAGLHCEFEGDGIYTMLVIAIAVLALLAISLIPIPAVYVAALILAAFLFLFGLLSKWLLATPGLPGSGDPRDIDPVLGTLGKGHIVVVQGVWVYDSLHPGWNEIHAVHACQIMGAMSLADDLTSSQVPEPTWPVVNGFDLSTASGVKAAHDTWCAAITKAGGAQTGGSKQNPQNYWVIHPIIDGCNPPPVIV
jgi:hypothetical protein